MIRLWSEASRQSFVKNVNESGVGATLVSLIAYEVMNQLDEATGHRLCDRANFVIA